MIEFRCQQCEAVLRTPDGTEGKQAKCPQCGALMTIPAPAARPAPGPPPREREFAPLGPGGSATVDPDNPFQPPRYTGEPQWEFAARGFHPTRIEFGRTFDLAWRIYKSNLGLLVLASLIMIVASMLITFMMTVVDIAVTGIDKDDQGTNLISILINLFGNLVSMVVQTFLYLGSIRLALNIARGEPASISDLFSQGEKVVTTVVTNILFGLAILLGVVLLIIPGIWAALTFSLFWFMIVDQNAGVFDSLKMSAAAMRGNKLVLLGLWLALTGITLPIIILTCGLGALLVTPFVLIVLTVVYLGSTGQLQPAPAQQ